MAAGSWWTKNLSANNFPKICAQSFGRCVFDIVQFYDIFRLVAHRVSCVDGDDNDIVVITLSTPKMEYYKRITGYNYWKRREKLIKRTHAHQQNLDEVIR